MNQFEKVSRTEMKNVTGGVVHICTVTCSVTEGVGLVVPYTYSLATCPPPSTACEGIGDYVGCVCQ
jgi:hypothetical protein